MANSSNSSVSSRRGSLTEESAFVDASDTLSLQQTRELPILDGGCPIGSLPQDLLLRYMVKCCIILCLVYIRIILM